jgi:uncharacterized membrane protein
VQSGLTGNTVKNAGVITDGQEQAGADDRFEDLRATGDEPGA